ncbi:hypothetical protein GCM10009613_27710 [Pseudonocardia kongjuensis]|uniref:Rhodanese domain-containing protein n=1 Tax=Pseudonocardia kongjuensis TaxID=102227 RepID=A0ABN1XTG6_9PSEU
MTAVGAVPVVASWSEPEGIRPRGTVVVVPGRGEHAAVYERFGRRVAADGYRVWAVSDPTVDEERTRSQVRALLDRTPSDEPGEAGPPPRVLVGSDTGALWAAGLAAAEPAGIDGLVLAGLPGAGAATGPVSWDDELALRTSCPAHRGRLDGDDAVRRGALTEPVPAGWRDRARPGAIGVPVLGLHGAADAVSPVDDVRGWYAALPGAELVSIADGAHDALNDQTHRTAAATAVLFLERLRGGAGPIARTEPLDDARAAAAVLVGPVALAAELAGPRPPVLLDVRWALGDPHGREHHRAGHLPGAVYVDLDTELARHTGDPAGGRHPLPEPADLQAAARRWGVRGDRPVVVYDASGGLAAARAWWLLRWGGHHDVRLLDGGLAAWQDAGFAVQLGEVPDPEPGDVVLTGGGLPVLDADGAAALATSGLLLDARAGERYRGETEPVDPRAGHVPGAVSAPTGDNLGPDGRFRPPSELRERFAALGVDGRDVGVYCGSGVTAAHQVAALAAIGVPAALYPGSWSAWSNDPARPAATGAAP